MKRLLLFVHYDRDGRVDEHIIYLLNALRPFCTHTAVIANSPVSETDADRLLTVADRLIRRPNKGFDFGAWGDVLPEYSTMIANEVDSLLLVNGSCFGPLFPFPIRRNQPVGRVGRIVGIVFIIMKSLLCQL